MFKTDRIRFGNPPDIRDSSKWIKFVRAWDKAGTKDGGCYTVGLLMAKDVDQRFWILDVIRDQWDSFERERQIRTTAEIDTRRVVVGLEQEPGSGGKESAEKTTVNLAGFRVHTERPTGDKELRADPFSVQVNCGNVWIPSGAVWAVPYLEELKFFPYSIDKDQVDASSLAFTILTIQKRKAGGLWKPSGKK
jgi:predicted phage terminase large subunit-like protein